MSHAETAVLFQWHHENPQDAVDEILGAIGDISEIEIAGTQVMLGCYVRPAVTRTGLRTGAAMQAEEAWQGKVGLILKMGPQAFEKADPADWGGRLPQVGDWVFSRAQDSWSFMLQGLGGKKLRIKNRHDEIEDAREWAGWPCRLVYARDIYGRVKNPHIIA